MMPNAPIMAAKREQARYYGIEMMPSDRYTQSGQKAVFGIGQRRDTLNSLYLAAAFLYALRGASHDITSRDFVCHRSPNHSRSRLTLWGLRPHPPRRKECDAMGKDVRIAVRVTAIEKEKIQVTARKCGLSTTEYVKQRALGYEPRAVPPDALFACLEKLGELADKASSPELDKEICTVLKQITAEFLLPGKG